MLVFLIILLCAILYTVPGLIALVRRHPGWKRVWLINVVLGFTVIGWLWSLREALRGDAAPFHKVYYSYNRAYGEKGQKKRFDLQHLPVTDVGLALGGLAVVAMLGTLGWQKIAPQPVTAAAAAATTTTVSARGGWTYSQDSDDNGAIHISTLMSDDTNAEGDRIPATLIVRKGPGGLSAGIEVDGQFTCSAASGGMIAVQFDGGKVEGLPCARRPDDTPQLTASGQDTLFIANPQAFIARAMKAHSLILSADVLNQGVRHTHFSPQGLDVTLAGLSQTADTEDTAVPTIAVVEEKAAPATLRRTAHRVREPRYKSWHE